MFLYQRIQHCEAGNTLQIDIQISEDPIKISAEFFGQNDKLNLKFI